MDGLGRRLQFWKFYTFTPGIARDDSCTENQSEQKCEANPRARDWN